MPGTKVYGVLMRAPESRLRPLNGLSVRGDGDFVVYWMIAQRRLRHSAALDHAVGAANELKKPLLIVEPLRVDYPWASDRMHRFVLDGMANHAQDLRSSGVLYWPYVEPTVGAGKGFLKTISEHACRVVIDDHPCFHYPNLLAAAGQQARCLIEAVDGCGVLPLRATTRCFATAHSFRRFLQRELPTHLRDVPRASPLDQLRTRADKTLGNVISASILRRWSPADDTLLLASGSENLENLPIDHSVTPVDAVGYGSSVGGYDEARARLDAFMSGRLDRYVEEGRHPSEPVTSQLSPYLHFGMISPHEVLARVADAGGVDLSGLAPGRRGARQGWWGLAEGPEAFLDQLVTWRELGFNMCATRDDYMLYGSLPEWAQATLHEHRRDLRDPTYDRETLEQADTHDDLWNAMQRQLVSEGRIPGYLRMLWGKNILRWSPSPESALQTMIHLNDKYALDGRDPNSYAGIGWVLGRYDRAWGPERRIFGKVRYMTSKSTRRKLPTEDYIASYA